VRVQILFFGMLKDLAGLSQAELEIPAGSTLQTVWDHYCGQMPKLAGYAGSVVLAHNRAFAGRETELQDGDEVALLPPVSGGTGRYTHEITDAAGHFFALTRDPIDERSLKARLMEGHDGAVLCFEGVVRNNSKGRKTRYLDYECYEAMAIEVMAKLGREIAASHPISRIGVVHRLGPMQIGEASVVIVVTSPHRRPAYDASLEAINRLKKLVPIWKKEYFEDGEIWVEGEWDESVAPR
jgi:MoaE-MoaD fusion protein